MYALRQRMRNTRTHTRAHTHTWPLARRFGSGWQAFEIYGGEVGSDKVPTKKQVPARPPAPPIAARATRRRGAVPVQMWEGRAQSWRRCGTDEPGTRGATVSCDRAQPCTFDAVGSVVVCSADGSHPAATRARRHRTAVRHPPGSSARWLCGRWCLRCNVLYGVLCQAPPVRASSARNPVLPSTAVRLQCPHCHDRSSGSVRLSRVRPPAHAPALQGGAPGDGS